MTNNLLLITNIIAICCLVINHIIQKTFFVILEIVEVPLTKELFYGAAKIAIKDTFHLWRDK